MSTTPPVPPSKPWQWPRHPAVWFFAIALVSAVLFLLTLHPLTGALGGLVYLLTGWLLPSIFIVAFVLGLVFLIPTSLPVKIGLAVILSFLFGTNTSLPHIAGALRYQPEVTAKIERPAHLGADQFSNAVHVKRRPWSSIFVSAAGPRVRVAGDDGCGCFYFRATERALYSDLVIDSLFRVAGRRGAITDYARLADPGDEARDVHIDLTLATRDSDFHYAVIEVFDQGAKVAHFQHNGIPLHARTERAGLGRERFDENFLVNAFDILLHDNVWTVVLRRVVPDYFPKDELETFFADVFSKS